MRRRAVQRWAAAVLIAVLAVMVSGFAGVVPASATPGPSRAPEYWFDSWHIAALWSQGVRGQGVTIAEIDTGVARVPELDGRVLSGVDLGSAGGDGRTDREIDRFGHGTAMASIMVARTGLLSITGIAPDAKILPIAVPLSGTTDSGERDHLAEAIRYAADHGAKIINMSLGGKQRQGVSGQACSAAEQAAVYHALSRGAIVTASIGNTGPDRNVVEDPAVCLGVVSVGAVDVTGKVADFSTRQPYLTFVAPGVTVPSLGRVAGEAYFGSGTSQATALASASIALVWSKYPKLSGRQIIGRILATLDSRRSTPSPAYGYGLLDTFRAVTSTVPTSAPNPVYAAVDPFLNRAASFAAADPPPPAGSPTGSGPGDFAVGTAPRLTTTPVLLGFGLGGAGVLLILVLGLVAVLGRRRAANPAGHPFAEPEPSPAPSPRPRPYSAPRPSVGPAGEAPETD